MFSKYTVRRIAVMLLGILLMGPGIALFKVSLMGNDPHTAMIMAIGVKVSLDFSIILIVFNSIYFVIELLLGRHYVGIGTFVNWFCVGGIASKCVDVIQPFVGTAPGMPVRFAAMFAGVIILSLGASMYQTADTGIAPYDVLSILMADRLPIKYFFCRMCTDIISAVMAFLLGGILGLGTLICAFGLGPFISFFNRHVSEKLCGS